MSRAKSRQNNIELCGDCGASDAPWASVTKGIFLCTQCCSVHRSMGKHISYVKSLLKSHWNKNQLDMIHALHNNGANNIWEHNLLESNSKLMKKKPTPKDPLSVKQEYIKAKHKDCLYALRENYEDGLLSVENELGKQLHASVRIPNLETSFRFLVLGADPNYFHDEKGSTPLHNAVKSEQRLQVELLLTYGADPACPDSHGKTPIDYSKMLANKDLYNRLIENQYEVTDRFSHYLSMQKPDHTTGVHFLIPKSGFKSNSSSLAKLQKLSNKLFEELTMDVFDEVDRREAEAIWLSCADTTDLNDVPFLPVDNTLSTTRNQGRQKLARFSTPELKSLVFDILLDTQRRNQQLDKGSKPQLRDFSIISDDDPLYDSVASDDDYAIPATDEQTNDKKTLSESDTRSIASIESTMRTNYAIEQLTKALRTSDATITNLRAEVTLLKQYLRETKKQNTELQKQLNQLTSSNCNNNSLEILKTDSVINGVDEIDVRTGRKNQQRPSSMYETREGLKVQNWKALKQELKEGEPTHTTREDLVLQNWKLKQSDPYRNSSPQTLYETGVRETVLQCTERVTRGIQQLVASIQNPQKDDACDCASKLFAAVNHLANSIRDTDPEMLKAMVKESVDLKEESFALQHARKLNDPAMSEQHFNKIRDIAFHLAKHTKEIVTKYSTSQ